MQAAKKRKVISDAPTKGASATGAAVSKTPIWVSRVLGSAGAMGTVLSFLDVESLLKASRVSTIIKERVTNVSDCPQFPEILLCCVVRLHGIRWLFARSHC